jgi:hypothetical protein
MGFRVRKSFKIAPGIRMTITPKSVGLSAGVRGARISANSSGRATERAEEPPGRLSRGTSEASELRNLRHMKRRRFHGRAEDPSLRPVGALARDTRGICSVKLRK